MLGALDDLDEMLDLRDAEKAKRLKEDGVQPNKSSQTDLEDGSNDMGDKSPPENGEETDSTDDGDADQDGNSDHGETDGGRDGNADPHTEDDGEPDFMAELKRMSSSDPNARNAHSMLLEGDSDENESQDSKLGMKKRKKAGGLE